MRPNRPRSNAFHFWSPKDDVYNKKDDKGRRLIEVEEGTPTPLPTPSPRDSIASPKSLVKHYQPLIYDPDDEACGVPASAFFPNIGLRVNTPVYDPSKSHEFIRPELKRNKGMRDELLKGEEIIDHTPKKDAKKRVGFRDSYPAKFDELLQDDLDVKTINEQHSPRPPSPIPFLSLSDFLAELNEKKE